jgi:hypothetical protein
VLEIYYYIDYERVVLECRVPSLASVRDLPYHTRLPLQNHPSQLTAVPTTAAYLDVAQGATYVDGAEGVGSLGHGGFGLEGCGKACPECAPTIDTTHGTVTGGVGGNGSGDDDVDDDDDESEKCNALWPFLWPISLLFQPTCSRARS